MIEIKLILVLLALAGLFCHTHGLHCYNVTDWSVAVPQITGMPECDEGVTTCVRPRFQNGAYIQADDQDPAAVIWGCGECGNAASCITPSDQDISNTPAIFMCYNNEVITGENTVMCDDIEITDPVTSAVTVSAETSCKRPKIDSDGNFMTGGDEEWGCGKCPDGSDSCVSCDGTGCNGKDFQVYNCLKYKKSSEGTWIKDDATTEVTCKSETIQQRYCKMPTPDNKAEDWNSCGQNCDDDQCKSCYGDTCNDRDSSKFKWCKDGPADTIQAEVANLPLKFCSDTLGITCQRPRIEYGKLVEDAAVYKCYNKDDCIPGKCEFCHEGNACNGYPINNHQCFNWSWDTNLYVAGDLQDCNRGDATIARCNMPKDLQNQVAYTPETNNNACGKCSTEQADNCITTYAGDNRTPTRYQCYTWTWNSNKYEMGGPVDCNALDPIGYNTKDSIVCNMPRDLAIENSYSASENDQGCGFCANGKTDPGCMGSVGARGNKPSDKQCYAWSWDSEMNKYVPGVLRHCSNKYEFRCNMPRDVTKQNDQAIKENGCGECPPSQPIDCITTPDGRNNGSTKMDHQCFSWSWVDDKYEPGILIECNQNRVWEDDMDYRSYKCNMPTKPEDKNSYKPDANANGCGRCVESDCITTVSGENKKSTHKCYKWTRGSQGWVSGISPKDCYQGDTEDTLKCSMPRNRSNTEGFNSNGCGPCPEEEANIADESVEYNCMTTDPEKNHGIQVLISFLALVLAFVNVVL